MDILNESHRELTSPSLAEAQQQMMDDFQIGVWLDDGGRDADEAHDIEPVRPFNTLQDGVPNPTASPERTVGEQAPNTRTRKRVLMALACPPALVAVTVAHTVLAVTSWITLLLTGSSLYLSVAVSYTVIALVGLWKVRETFQTSSSSSSERREAEATRQDSEPEKAGS